MIDGTAPAAIQRFGAVMDSIITPKSSIWHNIRPNDPMLMKDRETRLWYEQTNDLLFSYRYSPFANFASVQNEGYLSLGAFGTRCKFVDQRSDKPGLRYKSIPLGEIFIEENHQQIVDTVYRCFRMKGRQVLQQFGKSAPEDIFKQYQAGLDRDYEIIHVVKPNNYADPRKRDFRGKPFKSFYVCRKHKYILSEGGYDTMPYIVSRYSTLAGEKYGRSPCMTILPAIKTLNEQKRITLKQGHRAVDPIYLMADDGIMDAASAMPGSFVAGGMSPEGRHLVGTLQTGNIAIARDMMEDERVLINDALLITLFQILIERGVMTATETMERAKEKADLIAPIAGRQEMEDLTPMIIREVDLLQRQGILPPPTNAMIEAGGNYIVEFDTPISRMRKAESISGGMRAFQFAAEIAAQTQDPSALDVFNQDVMVKDMMDAMGGKTSWTNDEAMIAAKRKGRQEQAATQQMIDAGPSMASMMKVTANQ